MYYQLCKINGSKVQIVTVRHIFPGSLLILETEINFWQKSLNFFHKTLMNTVSKTFKKKLVYYTPPQNITVILKELCRNITELKGN